MVFWRKSKKQKSEEAEATGKKQEEVEEVTETAAARERVGGSQIFGVLLYPKITEKSTASSEKGKYVFAVGSGANKIEVRRAVEARYGVDVRSVNILNMPGKERKRGRQIGWRAGYKKAVVTLKAGQSIEIQ